MPSTGPSSSSLPRDAAASISNASFCVTARGPSDWVLIRGPALCRHPWAKRCCGRLADRYQSTQGPQSTSWLTPFWPDPLTGPCEPPELEELPALQRCSVQAGPARGMRRCCLSTWIASKT